MIYHEILGVRENASVYEIDRAYEKKIAALSGQTLINQQQYDRKVCELRAAKESCLSWRDKSFAEKATEKVQTYSSDYFSSDRVHEFCCGPCTLMDICAGALCTCSSNNDSFLATCCGCGSAWPAILCDVELYACLALTGLMEHKRKQRAKEEELAQEQHKKIVEDTEKEIASLRTTLSEIVNKIDHLSEAQSELEHDLAYFEQLKTFFDAIDATLSLGSVHDLLIKRNEATRIELEKATAEKRYIAQRIETLSHQLN